MTVSAALFAVIIYPIIQIIELVFVVSQKVFHNYGLAIIAVSCAVTLLCLPLYHVAEKWQEHERNLQKKMKPGIDRIKKAFHGDEQFLILSTFYRQNKYKPIYALRSSFGLLIQIPFFIAAYQFLSHLTVLKGVSFLFVKDLGVPDQILQIGGITLNLLPILMTAINICAGAIYTKGFPRKEKIQLYGMAFVFLILLYDSPSALVLYWTMNNVLSLLKNIFYKLKNPLRILYIGMVVVLIGLDIYVLKFHTAAMSKRYIFIVASLILALVPLFLVPARKFFAFFLSPSLISQKQNSRVFFLSALVVFLLVGVSIPISLIASSPLEFSFLGDTPSPLSFAYNAMLQGFGLTIVWPLCIFFLFSPKARVVLAYLYATVATIGLVNTFAFAGNYGTISNTLQFASPERLVIGIGQAFGDIAVSLMIALGIACLFKFGKRLWIHYTLLLVSCALTLMAVIQAVGIQKELSEYVERGEANTYSETGVEPLFSLSTQGKNVVIIMLDRAISGYLPYIFEEDPSLAQEKLSGFVWYPHTVSFGSMTVLGVPGVYGGYEYTPREMQKRTTQTLKDKHNEALKVLPALFSSQGFETTVTDPSWAGYSTIADLRIYNDLPEVHAYNIKGKYTGAWLEQHPEIVQDVAPRLLRQSLLRFSLLRTSPRFLRSLLYYQGTWLTLLGIDFKASTAETTLHNFAHLDFLPELTAVQETPHGSFVFMTNELTHEPAFFQAPDYSVVPQVTNYGTSPFSHVNHYHVNIAALKLLGAWFDDLRNRGVYDNTRIILVSDHGANNFKVFDDTVFADNGLPLDALKALLMVKDFGSVGPLQISKDVMTNADVPALAMESVLTDTHNPFTGQDVMVRPLLQGPLISTSDEWNPFAHGKFTFSIKENEWLDFEDFTQTFEGRKFFIQKGE